MESLNAEASESFKKDLRFEMNDVCRPQRIEVLKSNVGEMKVEFSHTRAHIEQIMGMRQQLLQAKSADGGQQKTSQVAQAGETRTMTAAAPEGHRAKKGLLAQVLSPQQQLLQG